MGVVFGLGTYLVLEEELLGKYCDEGGELDVELLVKNGKLSRRYGAIEGCKQFCFLDEVSHWYLPEILTHSLFKLAEESKHSLLIDVGQVI